MTKQQDPVSPYVSALLSGGMGAGASTAVGSSGPVYSQGALYQPPLASLNYGGTGGSIPTTNSTTSTAIDTASQINALNLAAQQAANASRIPNEPGLEAQSSANIGSELTGTIPGDVLTNLGRLSPEQSFGTGGSANIDYMKLLGLTSLDLQSKGQSDLSAATGRNPAAPLSDASQFVETPYQQQQLAQQQSQFLQSQQQQQEQFAANLALQQQYQQLAAQRQQLQSALQAQALSGGTNSGKGSWTPTINGGPGGGGGYHTPTVSYNPNPTGGGGGGGGGGSSSTGITLSNVVPPPDKYSQWWSQYGGTGTGLGYGTGDTYIQDPGTTYDNRLDPTSEFYWPE